jgi:hypothetical protein
LTLLGRNDTETFDGLQPIFENQAGATILQEGDASSDTSFRFLDLNNDGLIEVEQGLLSIGGYSSTETGQLVGAPGTTLELNSFGTTFTPTSSIVADQVIFDVSFGSMNVNGSYRANSTTVQCERNVVTAVTFANTVDAIGQLQVSRAAADFLGSVTGLTSLSILGGGSADLGTSPGGPVTWVLPELTLDGNLSSGDNFLITGLFAWSGGTLSGSAGNALVAQSGASLSGSLGLDTRMLELASSSTWQNVSLSTDASITNQSGFTLTLLGNNDIAWTTTVQPVFENQAGASILQEGGQTSFRGLVFNNDGLVQVDSAGTLLVGGYTQTATETGQFIGQAGTTLELAGGPKTFAPSASITADTLVFGSGSTIDIEVGGPNPGAGFAQISAHSAVDLGAGFQLDVVNGFTPSLEEKFTIISNQGMSSVSGTFAGLPQGETFGVSGYQFQISYNGGDGNDVVLTTTAVPYLPPVANAGGPYTMTYGGSLTLNASASSDPNGYPLTYSWTINGQANAATGVNPTLNWSQLQALGVNSAQPFQVSVQVSDGHSAPVTSQPVTVMVNQDSTTTTLVSSSTSNTALYGLAVTFTATVSANPPGAGTPTGSVVFFDTTTGTNLGTVTLSGGQASLSTAKLAAGVNAIVATYFGDSTFLASSNAVPLLQQASAGIILLDPTGQGALTDSGNGNVHVTGGSIVVNSSSSAAVVVSGNGNVTAPLFDVNGGISTTGGGHVVGPVQSGSAADPLASLGAPDPSTLTVQSTSTLHVSGTQSVTLNPGVYVGGIQISDQAHVTLNPGIYYLQGGGFSVSGSGSVTGQAVLLYNAPRSISDTISLTGNGKVILSAMTSGLYQGITLFQDRSSTAAITITGNGNLNIAGAIYAAHATLDITGNGGLDDQGNPLDSVGLALIVYDLKISGNGSFATTVPPL